MDKLNEVKFIFNDYTFIPKEVSKLEQCILCKAKILTNNVICSYLNCHKYKVLINWELDPESSHPGSFQERQKTHQ